MIEYMNKIATKFLGILFAIIIFAVFIANADSIKNILSMEKNAFRTNNVMQNLIGPSEIEELYNDNFHNKLKWVDLNGLVCNIIGQKINNGVVKDFEGGLVFLDDVNAKFNEANELKKISKAKFILNYAKKQGASVLYVQRPYKHIGEKNVLPYGMELSALESQAHFWCEQMEKDGFPALDLCQALGPNLVYYKTDHHWTIKSSFYAAKTIISKLNSEYSLSLDKDNALLNIREYNIKIYKDSFLGSEGVRAGGYYAGRDDFEIIYPKFPTNLHMEQYDNEHRKMLEKQGNFYETFIDEEKLNDESYNNKYSVYAYDAYIETRIINYNADNDLKVLLISDSYSRPMVTFFSLCFAETRYLDPQEGRYTDSYVEYIEKYDPDIVVMMFPGDGTFKKV